MTVGRGEFQPGLPPDVLKRVFQANPDKLPAYVGGTNERGGFSIVRGRRRCSRRPTPTSSASTWRRRAWASSWAARLLNAYIASLRAKADVKINQANLEKK